MPKAYLIGGTPRTGKTTLTMRCIQQRPMLAASTDALRYTLRRVMSKGDEPDLFHFGKFTSDKPEDRDYLKTHTDELIGMQNKESAVVWRSVDNFISSNLQDGFDVLIEGIAVMPAFVRQLDCDYRAVFLGNQSEQHYDTMLQAARRNPDDWMHSLEDETIAAFAAFNQSFSRYIQQEADRHDTRYVEVRDEKFNQDIGAALSSLLG